MGRAAMVSGRKRTKSPQVAAGKHSKPYSARIIKAGICSATRRLSFGKQLRGKGLVKSKPSRWSVPMRFSISRGSTESGNELLPLAVVTEYLVQLIAKQVDEITDVDKEGFKHLTKDELLALFTLDEGDD